MDLDPKKLASSLTGGIGAVLSLLVACYFLPDRYRKVVFPIIFFYLFIASFVVAIKAQRKAKRDAMAKELEEQGGATPRGISAPSQRARVDDLRKRFQEGLREYESRGKDLYSLPWYLICGESGSGKTEAIRHSEVGFPPGLNEFMQGSGGTINMNWWFTNKAVILDTAGRLMFEEVKAGETGEWNEFLKLLKKSRPNCPINGLFLTISVETLIKDTADKIGEKARQIAKQLDVIQRSLDVRFPVYVLVTKCDLAIGFREFFDGITDPVLQHQLIGWSNPEDLDAPFRADLLAEHLAAVARRLQRRRLALLRDPVAQTDGGRRLAEVDQLYALPSSISETVAVRLEQYLKIIFEPGEWSAKPVFFRGIYFTSSMREGSALDADLAKALGLGVTELPPTRPFEKERSFFLRDLFIEKAFRESGLVTGATNARKMLQHRQVLIYGAATIALLALAGFSWFGMTDLTRSVGKEMSLWRAANIAWDQGVWNPIVTPPEGASRAYRYRGDESFDSDLGSYVDYHRGLQERVAHPLRVSWIFTPISWLASTGDLNRKDAQRVVFERGVVAPLILATRAKILRSDIHPDTAPPDAESTLQQARLLAALTSLIRMEADAVSEPKTIGGPAMAQQYLDSWLNFITDTNRVTDTNLVNVLNWVYSSDGGGYKKWPPQFLLGGNSLSSNLAIERGLQQYFAGAMRSQKVLSDRLALLEDIRSDAIAYLTAEQQVYTGFLAEQQKNGSHNTSLARFDSIKPAKLALDESLDAGNHANLFQGTKFQLRAAYSNLLDECHLNSREALQPIYDVLPANSNKELFNELRRMLDSQQISGLCDKIQHSAEADKRVANLDATVLSTLNDVMAYRLRWEIYQSVMTLSTAGVGEFTPLIGKLEKDLAPETLDRLSGDQGLTLRRLREIIPSLCAARIQDQLTKMALFPLIAQGIDKALFSEEMRDAQASLQDYVKIIDSPLLRDAPEIKTLKSKILRYAATASAIIGDAGNPVNCKITIEAEQNHDTVIADRYIEVVIDKKSQGQINTASQKPQVLATVSLDKSVTINVRKYPEDPPVPVTRGNYPNWGPLGLIIANNDNVKRTSDGKIWLLKFPINKSNTLNLRLEFDRPLPELDQWTTP